MNHEELAKLIHGREYGEEITSRESDIAENNGLVVAFIYSDDCIEFRGAIHGCQERREEDLKIGSKGLLQYIHERDEIELRKAREYIEREKFALNTIKVDWKRVTRISIDCPHSTFSVMEDGELFCVGIVFAIADLKKPEEILA